MKIKRLILPLLMVSMVFGFNACSSTNDDSLTPPTTTPPITPPPIKDTLAPDTIPAPLKEYDSLLSSDAHDFDFKGNSFRALDGTSLYIVEDGRVITPIPDELNEGKYMLAGAWIGVNFRFLQDEEFTQCLRIKVKPNDSDKHREFMVPYHDEKYPMSVYKFRQKGRE